MSRRWLRLRGAGGGLLLGLLAAVTLPATAHESAVVAPGTKAPEPGSYTLPVLRSAPDGDLRNEKGVRERLSAARGDAVTLLSFIYTRCADGQGCPMASHVLGRVAARVAKDPTLAARVRFLSVSFDPARDTPQVLAAYAENFRKPGVAWRFLSVWPQTAESLLAAYGQEVLDDGAGGLSHMLRVFLIDAAGNIRNQYSSGFLDPMLVTADIATVARQPGQPVARPRSASLEAGDARQGYESPDWQSRSRALAARDAVAADLLAHRQQARPGLPALAGPEPTAARIALGRQLFFDRRLSHNGTVACASCHVPDQGYTSHELQTPVGIEGRTVRRNAPSLLNVGLLSVLFHDGREDHLEQQVWAPLLAANEMGNPSIGVVLSRLRGLRDYQGRFEAAFGGQGPTMETVGAALAAYERTLLAADSNFDRWRYAGQSDALSPAAKRGFELFTGKAGCSGCHLTDVRASLFTDQAFHNTGVGYRQSMARSTDTAVMVAPGTSLQVAADAVAASSEATPNDLGRYEITGDPADRWRFRTPGLRNVAVTAPYMHDGSLRSLGAVVAFYDAGGVPNEGLDPRIRPLGLDAGEQAALVAFLESLTSHELPVLVRDAFAAPIGDRRKPTAGSAQ